MANGDAQTGAVEKKRIWNSLEISRLILAAATPLALFALGYAVNQRTSEEARQAKAASDRETERVRKEGLAREAAAKLDEIRRDKEARYESFLREKALRAEGYAREKALRDEAFRRDSAVRREAVELARYNKLTEKRVELWDKLSPKLSQIDLKMVSILQGDASVRPELLNIIRDCDELFGLYRPYFSPLFWAAYLEYKGRVEALASNVERMKDTPDYIMQEWETGLREQYESLRDYAAAEVAGESGLLPAKESR